MNTIFLQNFKLFNFWKTGVFNWLKLSSDDPSLLSKNVSQRLYRIVRSCLLELSRRSSTELSRVWDEVVENLTVEMTALLYKENFDVIASVVTGDTLETKMANCLVGQE